MNPTNSSPNVNSTLFSKQQENKKIMQERANACIPMVVAMPLSKIGILGLKNANKNLTKDEIQIFEDIAQDTLKTTGLNENVNIHHIDKTIYNFVEDYKKTHGGKEPLKIYTKLMESICPQYSIAAGNNATFSKLTMRFGKDVEESGEILINMKKLPTSVFHEIGHAYNSFASNIWKNIQKLKSPAIIATMCITLISTFAKKQKPKKDKEGKLNPLQKTINFFRNHAGILTFAAMTPILAEEGMASIRGEKFIKQGLENIKKSKVIDKVFESDLIKRVSKGNKFAFLSYLIPVIGMSISNHLTVKAKDKIQSEKEANKK